MAMKLVLMRRKGHSIPAALPEGVRQKPRDGELKQNPGTMYGWWRGNTIQPAHSHSISVTYPIKDLNLVLW